MDSNETDQTASESQWTERLKGIARIVLFFVLVLTILFVMLGDSLRNASYDFFVKYVGGSEPDPDERVVLLLIDEPSMRYGEEALGLGRWPWPRSIYAQTLNFILRLGNPKAVFFDILFSESDNTARENDQYFAEAVANTGFVYHNMLLEKDRELDRRFPLPEDVRKHFTLDVKNLERAQFVISSNNNYTIPIACLRSALPCGTDMASPAISNIPPPAAAGLTVSSFSPDADGVYRRGRMLFRYGEHIFPSLSLAAVLALQENPEVSIADANEIRAGKYSIPVDEDGQYLVNFHKNRVANFSFSALMETASAWEQGDSEGMIIKPGFLDGKVVIIGVSFVGGHDLKNTAIDETTPGAEIHANLISNILTEAHITSEKSWLSFLLSLVLGLTIVAAVAFFDATWQKLSVFFGLLIVYMGTASLLFHWWDYLQPVFLVISGMGLAGFSAFIYLSVTEGAEKRKYSKILGNLVDPQIVSEALVDLEALKQGGEKEITAFFSDVVSFSTISEKLSSVDLARLLNEYLSAMTDILKKYGGTLDKYIGDAVVGIFGAPIELPDSAHAAARASLEMMDRIAELRKKWEAEEAYCAEARDMHFRIGLNTGIAKVGFMGTENLASYTMMGDSVNLAARLEAAGKDYGVSIMVSEVTMNRLKDEMEGRLLDLIRVKGKHIPVKVYELIGHRDRVDRERLELARDYEDAFDMYQQRQWENAMQAFDRISEKLAHDGKSDKNAKKSDKAVEMLRERCRIYSKEPPPENWDGVFTRTHK